jgi:hypothetical protein
MLLPGGHTGRKRRRREPEHFSNQLIVHKKTGSMSWHGTCLELENRVEAGWMVAGC